MNRLLLGDVGTGKTAPWPHSPSPPAPIRARGPMMAPTSVLARQYAEKLGPVLDAAATASSTGAAR